MSTNDLRAHLIAHLRSFAPATGDSIAELLTGGLFAIRAPDNAAFPHGVLTLQGREQFGDDSNNREEGRIELQCFGKPLRQSVAIENAADVAEQALLNYSADVGGQLDIRYLVTRDTLPPPAPPADREIAQVRLVWAYSWWPDYRTQYAIAAGEAP